MNNPERPRGFLRFDQIAIETKLAAGQARQQTFQTGEVVGDPPARLGIENRELTPKEQTILWANQVLEKYNSLPKGNRAEKIRIRNLAAQTARRLLANLQDTDIASSVWKSPETKVEEREEQKKQKTESFYDLIKQEVSRVIRKQWRTTTPKQFGQLAGVYADSVLMQDVLAEYINRPQPVHKFITIQEASEILRVHPNTLRRWGTKGTLKEAARLGNRGDRRYSLGDVMGLIDKG